MEALDAEKARQQTLLPRAVQVYRHAGGTEAASLIVADGPLLEQVNQRWRPLLEGLSAGDELWDWTAKTDDSTLFSKSDVEYVALTVGEEVQGLLITSLPAEPPPLSGLAAGEGLLYIEYVAIAPWNRVPLFTNAAFRKRLELNAPRFKGVGPRLMLHAVLRSIAAGRQGCIGLHSVPDPDTVRSYTRIDLASRDLDPNENSYAYFEGDAHWARSFLEKARGIYGDT